MSPPPTPGLSSVRVLDLTDQPAATWDVLAVRAEGGEALQSHAWGEFKREASGWTVLRYLVEDERGPLAAASLLGLPVTELAAPRFLPGPVAAAARPLAGRLLYAPFGPVLLRDEPGVALVVLRALRAAARRAGASLLIVDPAWPLGGPQAAALDLASFWTSPVQIQISTTGVLVPLAGDAGAQHALLSDNVARNVNRAARAGVTVERIGRDSPLEAREAAYRSSYEILDLTGRRKGFALRPEAYHVASTRALVEAGAASLFFARRDGLDVAHTVVHHCGSRALLFQTGERDDAPRRVPANFGLQWAIISWAREAGFRAYDMGGVNVAGDPRLPTGPDHPTWGLLGFKRQWGGRPVAYVGTSVWSPTNLRGAALRMASFAAARALGGRRLAAAM
ncbi:MAG: lipid II:glycine glycyltransferase FemX [Candidatus Limnocylindrales bacterium]